MPCHSTRSYLKNVFWPHIFVGASFQILDNQQVACGFKLGPAAILNQNPIFEMASKSATVTKPVTIVDFEKKLGQPLH